MTTKEKASKLVQDLEYKIEQCCNQSSREAHYLAAKQCALIAVDEIIEDENEHYYYLGDGNSLKYWQEVKAEIEKLYYDTTHRIPATTA